METSSFIGSIPRTPRKKQKPHTLTTSPYFSPTRPKRTAATVTRTKCAFAESPGHSTKRPRADFMTFESKLPLVSGPKMDADTESTIAISNEDVEWYTAQFKMLDNPSYAFNLRKSTYLNLALYHSKPVLVQERLAHDTWKLLIAVMLLNKTAGKYSIPIFWKIIERWSTPKQLSEANMDELRSLIQPLGLQDVRAKRMINLSSIYLLDPPDVGRPRLSRASIFYVKYNEQHKQQLCKVQYPPTPISHLPGVGAYALDSYRIFCASDDGWKSVMPTDKKLIRYLRWKWAFEGCRWEPVRGLVAPLDAEYLETLLAILTS